MKVFNFCSEQKIKRPLSEVFPFFENPANLARITPPSLGFKILTPPPIIMRKGAVIDYTIRIFGLPLAWQTLITEYNPPFSFEDVQQKGPYALWEHSHTFQEIPDGVYMKDKIRYAVGFGPFGLLACALFVRRDIENIFKYRAVKIREIFAA